LLSETSRARSFEVDVRFAGELGKIAESHPINSLVHFAAAGTVLTGFEEAPKMFDVSIDGALNALRVFQPLRVIYSSSCAVYGNSPPEGGSPVWADVHPISIYGLSKAVTEKALEQWARKNGTVTVVLRLGNVVGSGCAGLITYLVRHAVKYPDGEVPAKMRGGGRIHRDYVPVDYAVRVVQLALESDFSPGSASVFNVGSGQTMSNGDIAAILKEWLGSQGYRLNVVYQPEPEAGESMCSRLRTELTESRFNLTPPSIEQIRAAVLAGAGSCLNRIKAAESASAQVSA
jgi:nucleoside-diphosphate-sugar epimerase